MSKLFSNEPLVGLLLVAASVLFALFGMIRVLFAVISVTVLLEKTLGAGVFALIGIFPCVLIARRKHGE